MRCAAEKENNRPIRKNGPVVLLPIGVDLPEHELSRAHAPDRNNGVSQRPNPRRVIRPHFARQQQEKSVVFNNNRKYNKFGGL